MVVAPVEPCRTCGHRGLCEHIRVGDLAHLRASLGFPATSRRVAAIARRVLLRAQSDARGRGGPDVADTQDWCQDDAIRPAAPPDHDEQPDMSPTVAAALGEPPPPTIPATRTVTLTKAHPALAGPLPGQGNAAFIS